MPINIPNIKIYVSRFGKSDDGAVAVIVSLLMIVLLGFTALGVDVASLYRERAQLQSVSDLTAMSAMALPENANSRATNALSRNAMSASSLDTLETGRFLRNPAIDASDRFTALSPDAQGINAVRVVLQDDALLHFARIFTDDTHVTLNRTALATRTGATSFSLNSHLVLFEGTALNEALAQRFGVGATISLGDMNALASADIDLGELLQTLDAQTGGSSLNPAAILDATTTAGSLITALQSVLPQSVANSLNALSSAAGSTSFSVSSLVGGIDADLGLTATEFLSQIEISALDVVRALVAAEPSSDGVTLDTSVAVPGVISANTTLTAGEPPAQSGWIALGEEGVQLHRAAVRLHSEIEADPTLLGNLGTGVQLVSLNLPIYTELAGSTATLNSISCDQSNAQDIAADFATDHTPLHPANGTSLAALYLGTLNEATLGTGTVSPADLDFADLLTLSIVIEVPLLPDVTIAGIIIQARSSVNVGAAQEQTISFSHQEVEDGDTTKTFGSGDLLSTAVNDLLASGNTEFRVKPGQEGLVSGLAAPIIAGVLSTLPGQLLTDLAAPVDSVLDTTLSSAGLIVGTGELTLTGHHCELIRLVR